MPKRIPIAAAKRVAIEQGCQQIILVAWDGERTHVVTYGVTKAACAQAAAGGNLIKSALGFDEADCRTLPTRATS